MPENKLSEELRIESLNQATTSEYMHLFHRLSSMLGYSSILSLSICCYIIPISLISVNNEQYPNALPKTNLYRQFSIHAVTTFFLLFAALSINTVCFDINGNGLKRKVKPWAFIAVNGFIVLIILEGFSLLLTYFVSTLGLNLMIGEGILYLILIFISLFFWTRVLVKIKEETKPHLSLYKSEHIELIEAKKQLKAEHVLVKKKESNVVSILFLINVFFSMFFCCYYVYFTGIWFRASSYAMKVFIALVLHPLLVELVVSILKFDRGNNDDINHPFFDHLFTMGLEILMNLFRRVLFLDSNDISFTLLLVFVCGVEEIIARWGIERREHFLRKLFRKKSLTEIEMIAKRRFYAYSNTSRSILELVSIMIVPVLIISFSANRFAVNLGYEGTNPVNVNSLLVMTLIQLVVEMLVVYICTSIEIKNRIPMSDYFFHLRSSPVCISHFLFFCAATNWTLHNFKTIPTTLFCNDVNDPCSCFNFNVYSDFCLFLAASNGTNMDIVSLRELFKKSNSIISPSFNADGFSTLGSILGVINIIIISYLIINRIDAKQNSVKEISEMRKASTQMMIKRVFDDVTVDLIKNSSLQKTITSIESLCRGVSPSQAKFLQYVIEILKSQSKANGRVVDVESVLQDSSVDKDVVTWLKDQLMANSDLFEMKRKEKILSKESSVSDRNRLSYIDGDIIVDLSERRSSLIRNLKSVEIAAEIDKTEKQITLPSIDIDNYEAEDDFALDYLSWDFNVFSIKSKTPQSFLAWKCLSKLGLIEELKLSKGQLSNILLYVEQHYSLVNYDSFSAYSELNINNSVTISNRKDNVEEKLNNPYHNNLHGADVFQAVLYFSTKYEDIGGKFTSFDLFSVLFAAYIHDFNHPGLNSTYVISDWPISGISSTFGSESPLEKHHLAMAFNLMRNVDEYNFLSTCSSTELNYFRRIVTECVLVTDLAKSMPWISTSRVMFKDYRNNYMNNNVNSLFLRSDLNLKLEMEMKETDHKILLMQLAMKCADVGHPSRSLALHLEWSNRICAEFYSQGDKEKDKGMKISALCDRNVPKYKYPQSQIGFINFVSKPCFTLLNEVCFSVIEDEKPWLKNMKSNLEYWEERGKENVNKKNENENQILGSNERTGSSERTITPKSMDAIHEQLEKEEQRIESLNQDEASEMFHLFTRLCSILGYSLIVSGVVSMFLVLIGMPLLADSTYIGNNLPQLNLWKEIFVIFSSFCFSFFIFACIQKVLFDMIGTGLYSLSQGCGIFFAKNLVIYLICCSLVLVFVVWMTLNTSVDIVVSDFVLYILFIICFLIFWMKFSKFILLLRGRFIFERIDTTVPIKTGKKKDGKCSIIKKSIAGVIGGLFAGYYIYVMIIIYRLSSSIVKCVIALVLHPLLVELLLTVMKMNLGLDPTFHPFYMSVKMSFLVETSFNLFRRFLFNSVSSVDLTLMLVILSGFQEILVRSCMEWKELAVRKILGTKPLENDQMLAKRKYYAYSNTMRSILEIVCIILAPIMLIIFSKNRYAVDLGYNGSEEVDIVATVTSTILQLVIEVMVVYICSMIEIKQNIPMSDFFLQYRSFFNFVIHVSVFIATSAWILHNLKTVPTQLLCFDVSNPCSCPSFVVYQRSLCSNLTLSAPFPASISSNSVSNNFAIVVLSVVIVTFSIIMILYYVFSNRSENVGKIARISIAESQLQTENAKIKSLLDSTTTILLEKSTLQQSISLIENLCRSVSPSQAKLLQNVINKLQNQGRNNKNMIDIENLLQGSSNDQDVVVWLKDQLMSSGEVNEMRKKSISYRKKQNRFSDDGSRVGLGSRRKQLQSNYQIESNYVIVRDKPESMSLEDNKLSLSSTAFESDNYDEGSALDYLSWDFNVFTIKSKNPQSFLAWKCLSKLGIIEELKFSKGQLSNILLYVEQHYSLVNYDSYSAYSESNINNCITILNNQANAIEEKLNNPYHNNLHGADVFQAVLYFSTKYEVIGYNFSSFDLFSVLFAAYIHDFNHPGLNSTYVISDWPMSGISSTFGNESPLEKHHLAMAFNLMRNVDEYNFLSTCSSTELDHFRRIVTECVLVTDLAKSMLWISTSRVMFKDYRYEHSKNAETFQMSVIIDEKLKLEMEKKEMDHKILLMQLAIKCADVGHPSRSLDQHLQWSRLICAEFYSQGDKERGKGMSISALCDRNVPKSNYPQGQIGFINFVSKPCFTLLNEICLSESEDEKPWLKNMKSNLEYWEERKKDATFCP